MKAIDYYNQFGDAVMREAISCAVDNAGTASELSKLVIAFIDETKSIIAQRGVKSPSAMFAVIKEQNDKWNALCNLYVKFYGTSPLNRDGFRKYMEYAIPQLKGM